MAANGNTDKRLWLARFLSCARDLERRGYLDMAEELYREADALLQNLVAPRRPVPAPPQAVSEN